MCLNIKKVIAFTLAETLIVMGVIGIVSALTLPNLNSSTGEKEKIAKVKKIYQNLEDAYGRAVAVYGPFTEWNLTATVADNENIIGERITEFIKVSKNCKMTKNAGCFPKSTSNTAFNDEHADSGSGYRFITADGSSILVFSSSNEYQMFIVDINGPNKGSHKFGKDIFVFILKGSYTEQLNGIQPYREASFSSNISNLASNGFAASGWVIDYDNMDYLNADNTGKCKNGTVMNETNPRCK